ncbi:pilus assembly protein [Gynuella sunshinyii]|uniref:Tfp pilus assembly protein, tip-associated adhesin PilY1 n=1 Tax=Gynuella sunshinyii YC6258 TaxID=1445510 RepID=A0A0C5VVT4_9GAMM|nr:PilC/PilY family type IV pilus protein [Gynuella sunshinyii]AJQ97423.1 tfp pilus assembly protein, tip-associated adhesin PilY1 [Gynuella sunshinyii YC6258]
MKRLWTSALLLLWAFPAYAGEVLLSENPLEVPVGVEPNIVFVMDDSGSMSWDAMTQTYSAGGLFINNQPGETNISDAGNIVNATYPSRWCSDGICTCQPNESWGGGYSLVAAFNGIRRDECRVAAANSWRFRNSDFNPMYYNPSRTYVPWPGRSAFTFNGEPVPYSELIEKFKQSKGIANDVLVGLDDPYNPREWMDLISDSIFLDYYGNRESPNGNELRYYEWKDTDSDGYFDNTDEITEVKISTLSATEKENFQNWFNFYRSRKLAAKGAIMNVLEDMANVRVGYTVLNGYSNDSMSVASINGSPLSVDNNKYKLFSRIGQTKADGGTPLRQALYEVGQYFSCSSTDNRFGSGACPVFTASDGGMCQKNYVVLLSDGEWSGDLSKNFGNVDQTGRFAGDSFADDQSNTLADLAMYYYRNDLRSSLDDKVSISDVDYDRSNLSKDNQDYVMHQHLKTYTVAFGLPSGVDENAIYDMYKNNVTSYAWGNNKVTDMVHAAYNGRGFFYSSNNPDELTRSLKNAFINIQGEQNGASGISLSSQSVSEGEVRLFHAMYTDDYTGELEGIPYKDGVLDESAKWLASDQLEALIEDPQQQRNVYTYNPESRKGVEFDYANLTQTQKDYFETGVSSMTLPASYNGKIGDERVRYITGDIRNDDPDYIGSNESIGQLRDRNGYLGDIVNSTPVFVGSPAYSKKRDFGEFPAGQYSTHYNSHRNRKPILYVGANDGMLHGFDTSTGDEKFAYVPNIAMPKLYEYTLPTYNHQFYVDGTPAVSEAYVGNSWKTILVGGLGAGGKGYFGLDVTDPDNLNENSVLWEFPDNLSDLDVGGDQSCLGYSFSKPTIVMTNQDGANGEKRWAAIFGNGYNAAECGGTGKHESALFVVFLDGYSAAGGWGVEGTNYVIIPTGNDEFTVDIDTDNDGNKERVTYSNGLGEPRAVDTNADGVVDYIYAGDYAGNMMRFDLRGDVNQWSSKTLFKASYNSDPTSASVGTWQPVVNQPVVIRNDEGGMVVIFSTGSWMSTSDATSNDIQSLYGVWDTLSDSDYQTILTPSSLQAQELSNHTDSIGNRQYRTVTDKSLDYSTNGYMGWKIDFDLCPSATACTKEDKGERIIRRMVLVDETLFGVTTIPSANVMCSTGNGGWLFAFKALTGGESPIGTVFDMNEDQKYDDKDQNNNQQNAAMTTAGHGNSGSSSDILIYFDENGANIGTQDKGEPTSIGVNIDLDGLTGELSWKELVSAN